MIAPRPEWASIGRSKLTTERKRGDGAGVQLSSKEASAVRSTVTEILALMRRAHGLAPQAQSDARCTPEAHGNVSNDHRYE